MIIDKAFKVELNPNKEQKILLNKTFGSVRFIFNHALDERIETYKATNKSVTYNQQSANITQLKKQVDKSWLNEVPSIALQQSLRNLEVAFSNFFRGLKKGKFVGFPKFKSKNKSRQSFRLQENGFSVTNNQTESHNALACG
jgi:putative transposase